MKIYKWKPNLVRAVVALIGAFACGAVSAQVANTKHNLGSTGGGAGGAPVVNAGTAEVCVFCHTPHGSATGAAVPLWNKTLPSGPFTTYDSLNSASLEGEVVGVGSVSIACLSCHDGSQAMDSMLNEPGSGADNGFTQTIGNMAAGIANLGTDLSNDHPVGVQYGGGGQAAGGAEGAALADIDFKPTENTILNGTTVWWVDTEATPSQTREKSDMILYTRTDGTGALANVQQPFVECASCHDPHTANPLFLRTSNDGSAVCLACHTK